VLNFLIIVTEFIGVAFGLGYFGVSRCVSVPAAALVLIAVVVTGSFRRWERAMYLLVAFSLAAVPLMVPGLAHHTGPASVAPAGGSRGPAEAAVLVAIALFGTTVSPWQLFFQQSNVVDKRITARWLQYERADTAIGTALFAIGAIAVLVACAVAFSGTALHGAYLDAGTVADELRRRAGPWAGALFAVVLLDGAIIGAGAVTLSTSYGIGDVAGTKHSLHRSWRDARRFHGSCAALVILAAALVLLPGAPLGIVTIGVQALADVLLPSALVFLVLLCNDRAVLGPRVNPRWLNVVACAVVACFLVLSGIFRPVQPVPRPGHRVACDRGQPGRRRRAGRRLRPAARQRGGHAPRSATGRVGLDHAAHRVPSCAARLAGPHHRARRRGLLSAPRRGGRHREGDNADGGVMTR
jgi:Mn2+/Fe2+ NRAMP family transporter